jgi:hypothetical protein
LARSSHPNGNVSTKAPIALILGLLLTLAASAAEAETFFVTDTEGDARPVKRLFEEGVLVNQNGSIDFASSDSRLVFGGDVVDHGEEGLQVLRWLTELKMRHPKRVTLLWGNRDMAKLHIAGDVEKLATNPTDHYLEWLSAETGIAIPKGAAKRSWLAKRNTVEQRLRYALVQRNASHLLENHRKELERLKNRSVTEKTAARHLLWSLQPKGAIFEYLKLGQVAHIEDKALFVHCTVSEQSLGSLPDGSHENDVRKWVGKINDWGEHQMKLVEGSGSSSERARNSLAAYGAGTLDPGKVPDRWWGSSNDGSVIRGISPRDGRSRRLPGQTVIGTLRRQGINFLFTGHTPVGNMPLLLRARNFLMVVGDTSKALPHGGSPIISLDGDKVRIKGRTGRGEDVSATASPYLDSPYGKVTKDGFAIVGRSGKGPQRRYVLAKLSDRNQPLEVTRGRPGELHDGFAHPYYHLDVARRRRRRITKISKFETSGPKIRHRAKRSSKR